MFRLLNEEQIGRLKRARVDKNGGPAFCPDCGKALLQILPGGGGAVVWCKCCKNHVHC
ncbi:MAG: hypothetical protein FWG32_07845 [Oscillospiraceae bacterium]|nr:hypothetical protein [Oscillospiraceae bacterium]